MEAQPVIELDHVTKVYPLPSGNVVALDDLSLHIEQGEFVAIMGPSGSGNPHCSTRSGAWMFRQGGELRLAGQSIRTMSDRELTDLRCLQSGSSSRSST